jgi:hypothetical protein
MISSFVQDNEVVAKVGKHKLYASELSRFIPDGISAVDSTKLALSYINTWTTDLIFMDTAEKELSKEARDVSDELEDYKRSLLKYRYEQQYVNQKLDTSLTSAQIKEYYDAHPDMFTLSAPIIKAHFIRLPKGYEHTTELKKMIASVDEGSYGDSLVFSSAITYSDFDKKWVPVVYVARECGTEVSEVISGIHNKYFENVDANGNTNIVYVSDMVNSGQLAPIDYVSNQIKDILLSVRKQDLLSGLERDLIEKARSNGDLVIY